MKLSELESKILGIIGLRGDAALSEISALVKAAPHRCRYALDSLFARGVLQRRVVINVFRLGYAIHGVCASLSPHGRPMRDKIIAYLCASPQVGYVGEFSGEFELRFDLHTRSIADVGAFLSDFCAKFGAALGRKCVSSTFEIWDFPLKFLNPSAPAAEGLRIGTVTETIDIDAQDHQILRALSGIGSQSHVAIARRLGFPAASFDYRVKRLRERKVIVGYHVWPKALALDELGVREIVHRIRLSSLKASEREKILRFARADPAAYSLTQSLGSCDLEICSSGASRQAEREFSARLEAALGSLIDERSSNPVVEHHKVSSYPF